MNKFFAPAKMGAAALALLLISHASVFAAGAPSANDTARYLAGLMPSAGSPLARLTREGGWVHHARVLNQAWKRIEKNQLKPIRAWSKTHLPGSAKQMLYMFSGPDFLYASAFYPNAETYVLSALEPVGPIPNMARHSAGARAGALLELRSSMEAVLSYSFFITKHMKSDLNTGNMRGALPVLYVFLARAGNSINKVEFIALNPDGKVVLRGKKRAKGSSNSVAVGQKKGSSPGVRISFSDKAGIARTLYYFQTDLSNGGLKRSGFRAFSKALGPADALVKSASYLLHSGNFTQARDFLLKQSSVIIQDDSGIPLRHFPKGAWKLQPFGKYIGPIEVFPKRYQREMKQFFSNGSARPVKFGIGYRWRSHETNVLLAIKNKR